MGAGHAEGHRRRPVHVRPAIQATAPTKGGQCADAQMTHNVRIVGGPCAFFPGCRDRKTKAFAEGTFVRALQGFEDQAGKRPAITIAAPDLLALRALPGNRLEALREKGRDNSRSGQAGSGAPVSVGQTVGQVRPTLKSSIAMRERKAVFTRQVLRGSVLKDELAEPGVRTAEFARQVEVPANRASQIIAGKRSITGDTALRSRHRIGVEAQFCLNLQGRRDLARAARGPTTQFGACRPDTAPHPEAGRWCRCRFHASRTDCHVAA